MTTPRRPMRLTNLKIREVSSVDRGAGEHVKVAIVKRDDEDEQPDDLAKRALFASVASIIAADLDDIEKQNCIAETVDRVPPSVGNNAALCEGAPGAAHLFGGGF